MSYDWLIQIHDLDKLPVAIFTVRFIICEKGC